MKTTKKLQSQAFTLKKEFENLSQEHEKTMARFNYLCDTQEIFYDSKYKNLNKAFAKMCKVRSEIDSCFKELLECEGELVVLNKRDSHKKRWANHCRYEKGRKIAHEKFLKEHLKRKKERIAERQMMEEAEEAMDELQRPWIFQEYWDEIKEHESFLEEEMFMQNMQDLYDHLLSEIAEGNLILEDEAREMALVFSFEQECLDRAIKKGIAVEEAANEDFDIMSLDDVPEEKLAYIEIHD